MGKGKLKKVLGSSKAKKVGGIVAGVAGAVGLGVLAKKAFGGRGGSGRRRRKKSALYYIRETQRLKAKKKYERAKLSL